ncbi:unnamed protein product, partial [Prorocentrum cordatum]
ILLQREPSPALQRTSDSGPNDKAGSSPRQSSARYASGPTGCHAAAEASSYPDRCSKAAATRGNAARVYHIMQRGPPALKARAVRCALWSRAEQRGAMMDT